MLKNGLIVENMALKYTSNLAKINWPDGDVKKLQNSYQDGIYDMGKVLKNIQNIQIEQLNFAIQAWQLSMESMSNDFLTNYNKIIANFIRNLLSTIEAMQYNQLNFIESIKMNDFIAELNNLKELEFDEKIGDKIDLEEVESMINAKINSILDDTIQEDNVIAYTINKLIEGLGKFNIKSEIKLSVCVIILELLQKMN